jgi:uncharacterized protein YjiS (DUF1127 family)
MNVKLQLIKCLWSNAKFHDLNCKKLFCGATQAPHILLDGSGSDRKQEEKDVEMIKLLEQIGLMLRRWATYQRVRAELETYTERELNDMGMTRADIGRIALEAASLVTPQPKAKPDDEERRAALLRQRYSAYL